MLAASPHQKYTLHESRDLVCFIHMESPVDRTVSGTQEPITGGVLAEVNQLSRVSEGDANLQHLPIFWGFSGGAMVKNLRANAGDTGDTGSIPGSGRSPAEGNGNPLQYSCLNNPMDKGEWWATVHGVTKNQTQLSVQHSLVNLND